MTLPELKTMSIDQIKDVMKNNPAKAAEINELLRTREAAVWVSQLLSGAVKPEVEGQIPPVHEAVVEEAGVPSTEELAALAQREAAAAQAEIDRKATEAAEAAAAAKPKKFVREYQVRDDKGNALGRPTHLEASTMEELLDKMQLAHENATRFAHRMKNVTLKPAPAPKVLSDDEITAIAKQSIEDGDPTKATENIRVAVEQKANDRLSAIAQEKAKAEELTLQLNGKIIAYEFMQKHVNDFNPCEANSLVIGEYLDEHNLQFTLDNLEAAFADLSRQENKLAPVIRQETSVAVASNPPAAAATTVPPSAAIPAVTTEPVVDSTPVTAPPAASQPAAAATASTPATATNQPAARRPGVNGSLPPGSLSAERPAGQSQTLGRKELLKVMKDMDPEILRKKLKTDAKFVEQLHAAGIRLQ